MSVKKNFTGMAIIIATTMTTGVLAQSCLIQITDEDHPITIINTSQTPASFVVSNTANQSTYPVDEVYITMPKYCGVNINPHDPNLPYDLSIGNTVQCKVPTTTGSKESYVTLGARERSNQYVFIKNMDPSIHIEGAICQ